MWIGAQQHQPVDQPADGPPGRSRRAVLAGFVGTGAGLLLASCTSPERPAPKPSSHPLTPIVTGTVALIERYRATIATYGDANGRLGPLLVDHQEHLTALHTAAGTPSPAQSSASASPSVVVAGDPTNALAELRGAEQSGQADATAACLAAAPEHAALLGSIAACRATHVEVLS
jgi:hypothetical protein